MISDKSVEGNIESGVDRAVIAPSSWLLDLRREADSVRRWPLVVWLSIAGILALYIPVMREVVPLWLNDGAYTHGVFIFPIAAFLLWIQLADLRRSESAP